MTDRLQDDPDVPEGAHVAGRPLRNAAILTACLAIAHSVLFIMATLLFGSVPPPSASDADLVAFYSSDGERRVLVVGLYIMPFAAIAFLWFIVALRQWIELGAPRARNVLFSNVQLVSGIVFLALFLVGAAATAATAANAEFTDSPMEPSAARILPSLGQTILIVMAMRMAAIFVFSTTAIIRDTRILPGWFVVAGYVVGLFLLLGFTFSAALVLAFPVWLLVLGVLLLVRARRIPVNITIDTVPPRGPLPSQGG
jgi:hypothetical protein